MIIEKRILNGLPYWVAYYESGLKYEIHINKLQGKIGIGHFPQSLRYGHLEVLDFADDLNKIEQYFNKETLKEICEYIGV